MEGYKKTGLSAKVLSAPVCTWIFLSTLVSYKLSGTLTTVIICLLAILTALTGLLTFRSCSARLDSVVKKTAAAALLVTLFASLFLFINKRTGLIINPGNLPDKISGFTASIDSVDKKRYNSNLYFTRELSPGVYARGILCYTGSRVVNPGSLVAVHKNISRINPGNNGFLLSMIREGIHYRGTVDDSEITVVDSGMKTLRTKVQDSVRTRIMNTFPSSTSALIIAIYFGDTTYLEKKQILYFRDAGTLHLLAASGMNIALVASIPLLLLLPPGIGRRKALLASALVTCLYLFITNMPVSLVRASAMYMFMTAGALLSREKNSFNSLYMAGSVIILLMPWELLNPGFQLSFGATAGILFFYDRYRQSLRGFPAYISKSLAVTFAAQLAAFPVICLHMNQFNPAGCITNLAVIPLVTIITLLSLAVLGISIILPLPAAISALPVSLLSECVFTLNENFASMKLNFFMENNFTVPAAVLAVSAIPLIDFSFFRKMKAWPVFTALIAAVIILRHDRDVTAATALSGGTSRGISIEHIQERHKVILKFDEKTALDEGEIFLLRKINPDIKIIEISRSTYDNITACRILMNDFIIEECIVSEVKSIDANFTGFLKILQKENIKVIIRNRDRS